MSTAGWQTHDYEYFTGHPQEGQSTKVRTRRDQ